MKRFAQTLLIAGALLAAQAALARGLVPVVERPSDPMPSAAAFIAATVSAAESFSARAYTAPARRSAVP